ncbi:NAD(P)-binding domain-containing protein [Natronoglycomyces albus]|uniref:NAD(P)-binding domain-containing protein n=1 Tax=Natronoglycomyces albus TaxID=2811108 RepID=A0A895XQ82_9ACTN|nr:NAD(P)-binding domain-containing protein [Natronoglycomyces albus]QSB04706.1 NAD(P)-binding domain-containing protein [Natronoglycomyces albus]
MASIGIIGVGEIGRALVTGLQDTNSPPHVWLSPRNAPTASALSAQFEAVRVCADNQEVVDHSQIVVISVRPSDQDAALDGLRISREKTVINVMAGVFNDDLRRRLSTEAAIVRAIPLPAVSQCQAITVVSPSHPQVNELFDQLGGSLPVASEDELNVFSALTATLSTQYRYLTTTAAWAVSQGLSTEAADRYVRGLFQGIGRALEDRSHTLDELAARHETPNGINHRIRTTWFDEANVGALTSALDELLASLSPPKRGTTCD